jgi:hypothetical protein
VRTLVGLASFPALAAVGLLLGACQSDEFLIKDEAAGFNGGFEVAENGTPVNWAFFPDPTSSTNLRISLDANDPFEGSQSLQAMVSPGEDLPAFRSGQLPLTPGGAYRIGVSLKNSGCSLKVNRIVQDRTGMTVARRDLLVDTDDPMDEWTVFEEQLTVREGEAQVMFVFMIEGACTAWFDDLRIEEL